jgi:hypothetical protein
MFARQREQLRPVLSEKLKKIHRVSTDCSRNFPAHEQLNSRRGASLKWRAAGILYFIKNAKSFNPMAKQTFDIDKLRVASPCSVGWDAMTGDERARHCDLCQLNVYNISEMTRAEAENLITSRESRLCIRLYKRADGTVLTKDCPVGWRAYQKRMTRLASATLATVLGLFSISFGQKDDKKAVDASKIKITRTVSQETGLGGTVLDPNGAVVPGAEILLFKDKVNVAKVKADDNGYYSFSAILTGTYSLEVIVPGFLPYKVKNIKINGNERSAMDISLEVDGDTVVVGIFMEDPPLDMTSTSVKTTITKDMMNRLPH